MLTILVAPGGALADASGPCGAGSNPIVCENSQPGTPMSQWYAPGAWGQIQGFSTAISVHPGDTLSLKVSSPVPYTVVIYRLGWYGGDGARLMPSPTQTFPASTQPSCDTSSSTGEVDCGNWSVTATWTVPDNAVSGVYLADLDQSDGNGLMPFPFVVSDPTSHSNIVVQTSDQTWEAYNMWGGADLYQGNGPAPDGRDYAVSYNRPINVSGDNEIFGSEYAMIQWLERNGYDVSYLSGIDVSTQGSLLLNHKIYMSSGHDEYWNQSQWNAVNAAKDAGVNLAFFSGNELFWRTELQPSIADGGADRTLTTYKMTKMEFNPPDGVADPSGQWTGTWMDPVGAGTGGGQPGNQLSGTLFSVNGYRSDAITISYPYSTDRLWRNTAVASLQPGQTYNLQQGTLGYEWDSDVNNAFRPPGEIDLSSTTVSITNGTLLKDYGNTYGNGTATHNLVEYRDPKSGALIFGAGTVQWSWGLSTVHADTATSEDPVMQQATVNLLADMGVQPQTLQSNLVAATGSTVTTGPAVSVASPNSGASVPAMQPVTITGTAAAQTGAVVARVEVSADGGTTWRPATGLGSWSYSWTPTAIGSAQLLVRAEDDSDNVGGTVTIPLTVTQPVCPCSVFPNATTPTTVDSGDGTSINVGMKFTTTQAGAITGVRFYKAPANTGTHVGSLWTAAGQLLGSVTFTNETTSGWQNATFAQPIPVSANTTYVVSYLAPAGHYSADSKYFATQSAGIAPITATSGQNGVYKNGTSTAYPSSTFNSTNYWVDAIFQNNVTSTTPPSVTATTPTSGATGVAVNTPINASLSEGVSPGTIKFTLTDQNGNAFPGTVSYDPVGHVATFQPSGQLALGATYTASFTATDLWGNAMPSPTTWTFTTSSTPPPFSCPCSVWNGAATPTSQNVSDTKGVEVGMKFQSAVAGYVTGVSFYKGVKNTGTHIGDLWSAGGQLLATGTFTGETASGWQSLTFSQPVSISANTTYVASYYAPNGYYAANSAYFTGAITAYPLTAPGSTQGSGNGVYKYGSSSAFPNSSYNSTNYWVDVSFTTTTTSGGSGNAPAADASHGSVEPAVASSVADDDDKPTTATTTGLNDAVHPATVTFPQAVEAQSIHIAVTTTTGYQSTESPKGTRIAGTVVYDPVSHTAAFRPSAPLLPGAVYHAVATATSVDGTPTAPVTWTFENVPTHVAHPVKAPAGNNDGTTPAVVTAASENGGDRRTDPVPTDT